jgi:hypothetical protein
MLFVNHDFYYNVTNSANINDVDALQDIFTSELSELVVKKPDDILKVFKDSGIKFPKKITLQEIVDICFENLGKNLTFRKSIAFLIADQNNLTKDAPYQNVPIENPEKKDSKEPQQKKEKQLTWVQKVNGVKEALAVYDKAIKENSNEAVRAKEEAMRKVRSRIDAGEKSVYPVVPVPREKVIAQNLFVLAIIAFVAYKIYKALPSEEEKMAQEMAAGGNASGEPPTPQTPPAPAGDTSQQPPTPPQPPTPTPNNQTQQNPYGEYDYSGK